MSNKSLITIRLIDAVDNPIKGRKYKVINNKTGQIIAAGPTNNKGCIVEISRDKGTTLDVYFESAFGHGLMKVPQNIVMSKDRMIVTLRTKEIKVKLSTKENQGTSGTYKRKTYTIKKGDTLSVIAQKEGTTVRALVYLNNLKNPDKLAIGQVLKLPVNVPATGNNNHQNKPKPKQQKAASQSKTKDKKSSDVSVFEQAKQKLNEYYEEGKKKIDEASKVIENILTIDDRSKETTSPKVDANNLCKTKPQCISSGKSELIREVNIRLAGFGGALPSDEFTDLTASCIKQFQRDYMGAPETGKICGSVLVALDKFYYEYPISEFMGKAPCPCGQCSGYGNNRHGVKSGLNIANEYPGLHRSLIWILKALNFYLKNEFKDKELEVAYIESGYRCIDNNKKNGRTSVNHMGLALDIHFNKKGKRTRELTDMEFIRKKVLSVKMKASEQRINSQIYLEPKKFKNGDDGATTWVHFDITKFPVNTINNLYFKKTVKELNGMLFSSILKNIEKESILSCSGILFQKKNTTDLKDELVLSNQDIIDIMKVTETEVIKFKNETTFSQQAAGVVDTILNRTKSGVWGNSVRSVVNAYRQFSKITGPENLDPYGSVQNMPISAVSSRIKKFVNNYLIERANGQKSIIGGHLNYANKYYSDAKNRKQWVDAFHEQAVKDGLIFGNGKAIHAHGTVVELRTKMPGPFKVILPEHFSGV